MQEEALMDFKRELYINCAQECHIIRERQIDTEPNKTIVKIQTFLSGKQIIWEQKLNFPEAHSCKDDCIVEKGKMGSPRGFPFWLGRRWKE